MAEILQITFSSFKAKFSFIVKVCKGCSNFHHYIGPGKLRKFFSHVNTKFPFKLYIVVTVTVLQALIVW